tara:strand:+ start:63 stop:305 length:243 start_codon:yes stop_codon:yes gene_type:complete
MIFFSNIGFLAFFENFNQHGQLTRVFFWNDMTFTRQCFSSSRPTGLIKLYPISGFNNLKNKKILLNIISLAVLFRELKIE